MIFCINRIIEDTILSHTALVFDTTDETFEAYERDPQQVTSTSWKHLLDIEFLWGTADSLGLEGDE